MYYCCHNIFYVLHPSPLSFWPQEKIFHQSSSTSNLSGSPHHQWTNLWWLGNPKLLDAAIIDYSTFHYWVGNQQFYQKLVFCWVLIWWRMWAMVFWEITREYNGNLQQRHISNISIGISVFKRMLVLEKIWCYQYPSPTLNGQSDPGFDCQMIWVEQLHWDLGRQGPETESVSQAA